MPTLNRRRFLQVATAAGLSPALPAFPARAATVTSGGASTSQMLWASLQARSGSPAAFKGIAQSMGISGTAAQGIYAKALQTRAMTVQGTALARRLARPSPPRVAKPAAPKPVAFDFEKVMEDTPEPPLDMLENDVALDTEDGDTGPTED